MKLGIKPLASDIIITIYVVVSLFYRIKIENEVGVTPLLSLVIGACLILILWSLIKLKVLNPNWFGLFNYKKSKP
jgi:hypothetical protein